MSQQKKIPIPTQFHSIDSKSCFTHCIECDTYLLDESTEYFIEKSVRRYHGFEAHDVMFEYAICLSCAEEMKKKMSAESINNLNKYFEENMRIEDRIALMHSASEDVNDYINLCMVSGQPINQSEEYQIFAHCKGDSLILGQMPYMVCGAVIDQISTILSAKTRDEMDDFASRHFGPPPELEEALSGRRVLLV